MHKIEELTDRVERLLLRHEELQRTNALLRQELLAIYKERDSLKTRLAAARSRIDTLINKLPLPISTNGTGTCYSNEPNAQAEGKEPPHE